MKFVNDAFDRFAKKTPISVMVRATTENVLSAPRLDAIFDENAEQQYAGELMFSTVAIPFSRRFDEATEGKMRGFYATLSEKDRRRFAAIEAEQLGHGGTQYVADVLGCSTRTMERSKQELDELPNDPAEGACPTSRGRSKKKITPNSEVVRNLKSLLKTRTAGDPDTAIPIFRWIPKRRSTWAVFNAPVEFAAASRFKPSITISPVGPTV